ncbi:protein kinase [Lentinula detonsa]|uniref:Protein kinase n=1 Tax=Lentinula detonsa TaxID=2804962 RepID=A0AA38Q2F4_9AGAR|nr:protein kinase [Lentinula detonsa]
MERIPENHPSYSPQVSQTPKKKKTDGPDVVQSTPQSNRYCAHAQDEVAQIADVLNKFLEDDVSNRVVFSLNEFATIILGLPPRCDVQEEFSLEPESEAVKDAFEAYLKVAIGVADGEGNKRTGAATHEKELYQPLANLLNTLRDGTGCAGKDIDEKILYVQDPRPVLGSLLERKPDLGAIYTQLLGLAENVKLSEYLSKKKITGVFWGLLLFFVEVKHRKGNFVGLNKEARGSSSSHIPSSSRIQSASRTQSKNPSSTDTLLNSNALPFASTAEERPRVTIHQSGGKEKTVEVMTLQYYAQRAEDELKAEQEMTPTQGQHHTRIQCASYAKEMLSNGFIRNHAMGIVADDCGFRFQYYDRSKVIESQAFHILDDEWKKLFMAMVCQLNKLDHEKLGFIPHLDLADFDHLRDSKQFAYDLGDDLQGLAGARYSFTGSDGLNRTVIIENVLYRAEGIIGRCSVVVEVRCVCTLPGCHWHGGNKIMKISFPSRTRTSEEVFIRKARAKAETSGDHWAFNHLPNIIDSITITYDPEKSVQGRLKAHLKEKYEERVMRVTILEKLHPLSELRNLREFAQVFYDILQIHQWLYECVGILHRDLSIGNIMFRRIDGKVYGVLNDFDLSSSVRDMRTGTRPFMSPDLLTPLWKRGHLYRHDLESLFFIVLCLACRYEEPGVPAAEPRAFTDWFSGTDDQVRKDKKSFIDELPQLPIQPYFVDFTHWLAVIRNWLYRGHKERPGLQSVADDLGEFSNDAPVFDPHYDWGTLNGYVSYAKFRKIMSSFQNIPLETRWSGYNRDH